jgi:hypothetical protein
MSAPWTVGATLVGAALAMLHGCSGRTGAGTADDQRLVPAPVPVPVVAGSAAPSSIASAAPAADCPKGDGKLYLVGADQPLKTIGEVPWERLGPGDTVRIAWRPEPYKEKIHLSSRGTAAQPIRVCGVRGPAGQLPVLSGRDATTRSSAKYPYVPTQERGLVIVTPRTGYRWGEKPGHIVIQDLELRDAHPGTDDAPIKFKDADGAERRYNRNAAALYIERGEHIVVRGCTLTASAYSLFVASGGTEEVLSREILVEANWIYGGGIVGVDRRHNVYSEAAGITFQLNRFGPQVKGALGNQLKDRSTGTVIRYNWIEGGAHLLDLVEPEESADLTTKDPRYPTTFVYGNVLVNGPDDGGTLVHYGGDNGVFPTYRKGTLHFFHNTVLIHADSKQRYDTVLLKLETADETAEVRNNVVVRRGTTNLNLLHKKGTLRLGSNWISEGFSKKKYADGDGIVEGLDQLKTGSASPFKNADALDLQPSAGSPIAGAGGALAADVPATHAIAVQYVPHQQGRARKTSGKGATLGAFESP